jgi:hypothetical protein
VDGGNVDALEYAEKITDETLDQVRDAYDAQYERVYKFATLVASGAGAAGVYAVGKIGTPGPATVLWALAALSCWWFLILGAVLLAGARSEQLLVGTASAAIRGRIAKHTAALNLTTPGTDVTDTALWLTRWDQLAAVDKQIDLYSEAATRRARVLDYAYSCLVGSPLIAAVGYALAARYA